jgi:DNA-binding PadR family transcriptional regulator
MRALLSTKTALLLALREGPGFGLDLIRRLATRTGNRVRLAQGRVYPALRALQKEGLVTAASVSPGGRRGARSRTYYDLTVRGVLASTEDGEILTRMARIRTARAVEGLAVRRMADRLRQMDELSDLAAGLRAAMLRTRAHRRNDGRK